MIVTKTKRSLADLAAAFAPKTNEGGNQDWKKFFGFWKAPVDSTSTVRFLPDADDANPMAFLVENHVHELNINGKRETVACLKMYGEPCPICELSAQYYDKKSPMHSDELGKTFYRKKSYIGQALVIETPVEHDATQLVKLIEFGPQVFKTIQAGFQSGDMDEAPYELKGGYNFRLRKSKTGSGQNSYSTSSFAPKQSDVADDLIASIELFNLSEQRTKKTDRATLEAMLKAHQSGAAVALPTEGNDEPASQALNDEVKAKVDTGAALADPANRKQDVVTMLKERQAAAKAASKAAA